jgi:O-antigen/teichoic acid export membrane protein
VPAPSAEGRAEAPVVERRLALGGIVSLIGSSLSALVAMLISVIVVREVGTAGGGRFFQAVAIFSIAIAVLRLGTHTGLVRSISRQRALARQGQETLTLGIAVGPVIVVSALGSVVLFLAAGPASRTLAAPGEASALEEVLRLMAPFVLVGAALGVLHYGVRVMRGPIAFTLLQDVAMPLGRLAGVLVAAWAGWDATQTIAAWLAALPLWLVVTVGCLVQPVLADLRRRRRHADDAPQSVAEFWRFSGPRGVAVGVEIALEWSDVLIVAAGRVVDQAARVAVSPTIAAMLARGDHDDLSRLHTSVTRVMILLAWPYYLTLVVMGPAVMKIFGAGFVKGAPILAVLAMAMLAVVATGMLQSIMLMGGKSSWQVWTKSFALALSLSLNLTLVPRFGAPGAAAVFAVVVIVDAAAAAWLVHRGLRVHLAPRQLVSAMALPTVVFGAGGLLLRSAFGTSLVGLLGFLGVLGAVYLVTLWLLRERLGLTELRALTGSGRPGS